MLVTYALAERRMNQVACPHCNFRVSVESLEKQCPRCRSDVRTDEWLGATKTNPKSQENRAAPSTPVEEYNEKAPTAIQPDGAMTRPPVNTNVRQRADSNRAFGPPNLARHEALALIALILITVIVHASVAIYRRGQPRTALAIRMVQEGSSRIENFTVQQYIYAMAVDNEETGSGVVNPGWQAEDNDGLTTVEFRFANDGRPHKAVWTVDLAAGEVTPQNNEAVNLSWYR